MSIDPATRMGAVCLRVSDLGRALDFCVPALGLAEHSRNAGEAVLGAPGGDPLLRLKERPEARPRPPHATGLYHFAVLVPSRRALAEALVRLTSAGHSLRGASDHSVSEALYLRDPDGNGIEIYRDRPRSEWELNGAEVTMRTLPLDVDALVRDELQDAGTRVPAQMEPETTMGHVHLQVSDLAEAERFYNGVLGFDVTARYGPAALFLSAGGYHHHLGTNTWNSKGGPPLPSDSLGLDYYTILLPDAAAARTVQESLSSSGIEPEVADGSFSTTDPFGIRIRFTAPPRSSG